MRLAGALALTAAAALGACDLTSSAPIASSTPVVTGSSAPAIAASSAPAAALPPTAAEGRALVEKHQCNRCHQGTGLADAPPEQRCVGCHAEIAAGRFAAPPAVIAKWTPQVMPLRFAPSLEGAGNLLRREWLTTWLLHPTDLRPGLHPVMPRLALSERDAQAIALHLASLARTQAPSGGVDGDADRGRLHFKEKGCARCHAFSGSGGPRPAPVTLDEGADRALAPDLRFARERLRPERVATWIADPAAVKPDAAMPKQAVTPAEAADLAAFILKAPLDPLPPPAPPARLPVLSRPVTYQEVADRVLHKICWHCHSQPDFARGDGGPGNTGGFGFAPRRIDLASYESIAGGFLDRGGQSASLFSRVPGRDEPMLVAVLLARQEEELGRTSSVRGMPLGLPALPPEDIQLVESWVAQGSPR